MNEFNALKKGGIADFIEKVNELRKTELKNYFTKIKPLADAEWEM